MRKKILNVVAILMCVFMLAGCGAKTIEKKYSSSDLKKMNEQAYDTYVKGSSYYKDVKIEIEGNHIIYKLYYKMDLDDDQIAQLKTSLEGSGLQAQIDSLKDQFKKECGIRPDKISYTYYTNDDKEIITIEE